MIVIKKLRKTDVAAASKIAAKSFSKEYGPLARKEVGAMFDSPPVSRPTFFGAYDGTKLVGFAGYIVSWMDYEVANAFWINVDPAHQGQGIGTMLVEKVIKHAREDKNISLLLLTASKPEFYRKRFGFRTISKFGDQQDHLLELKIDR